MEETAPVVAALTLFYDRGRHQYKLVQPIAANDQWLININELIRNRTPDENGQTLPPDLTSGAYQLREASSEPQNLLYKGKVITDKTYGHATYGCMVCCGYVGDAGAAYFVGDPTNMVTSRLEDVDEYLMNACNGQPTELTSSFQTWTSLNTGIVTATPGQMKGVSPGKASVRANATHIPSGQGQDQRSACPYAPEQGTGTGAVSPTVTFSTLSAVAVGGSVSVSVSFNNGATTSVVPITLSIAATTGSGSASFSGSSTMSISAPTTVTITGVTTR